MAMHTTEKTVLIIDNFDSFTHNLAALVEEATGCLLYTSDAADEL